MAGVSVDGGKSRKRALDSEINMIPMIDLLMVTVSFLLITAVWAQSQRLEASGQVPGSVTAPPCEGDCKEEPKLHVETSDPTKFVLAWKQGRTVLHSTDIARDVTATKRERGAFQALATKVEGEWRANGSHREPSDKQLDHAVVHAANEMPYSELIAVMDAVAQPRRSFAQGGKVAEAAAFEVILASD